MESWRWFVEWLGRGDPRPSRPVAEAGGTGGADADTRRLQAVLRSGLDSVERDAARARLLALQGHGHVREARPAYGPAGRPEATVLVIDCSGSMEGQDIPPYRLAAAQDACDEFLRLRAQRFPRDSVAVVRFNDWAWTVIGWTFAGDGLCALEDGVRAIMAEGGTDIEAGLRAAGGLLDDAPAGTAGRVVLLTDGHGGRPVRIAEGLKSQGVLIDVIGVGGKPEAVNEECLREVASVVDGDVRYRFIRNRATLIDAFRTLANRPAR